MLTVLFHPLFLSVVGVLLAILKLAHVIDISWLYVALPFVIRPIVIQIIQTILQLIAKYETSKFRRNIKEGDGCFYYNLMGDVNRARVESVNRDEGTAKIRRYNSMLLTEKITNLYPINLSDAKAYGIKLK